MNIKDNDLEKAAGGWGKEVPMVGPFEKGIPGAKVNNMSLACEYYLEIARAAQPGHCACCHYISFSNPDIQNPGYWKCRYLFYASVDEE